jgi:hypothetical protein
MNDDSFDDSSVGFGEAVRGWMTRLVSLTIQLLMAAATIWGLMFLVIYATFTMWTGYSETGMGIRFAQYFSDATDGIRDFFDHTFWKLNTDLLLITFINSLVIATISQLTSLARYFYDNQGWLFRFFTWGVLGITINTLFLAGIIRFYQPWGFFIGHWVSHTFFTSHRLYWPLALFYGGLAILAMLPMCFKWTTGVLPNIPKGIGSIYYDLSHRPSKSRPVSRPDETDEVKA